MKILLLNLYNHLERKLNPPFLGSLFYSFLFSLVNLETGLDSSLVNLETGLLLSLVNLEIGLEVY